MKIAGIIVAEWNSVHLGYAEVDRFLKEHSYEMGLLEVFPVQSRATVAFLKSSSVTLPVRDLMASSGLTDFLILEGAEDHHVLQAFYGLKPALLQPKHALGILQTSTAPLGFAIAECLRKTLSPESLLECKIGRAAGGAQLFVGAEAAKLMSAIKNLDSGIAAVGYAKVGPVSWESSIVEDPHPELRKLFAFENI